MQRHVNWIQAKTNLLRRFPSGARYLIGVSGGRDSVVLLDAIADLDYRKLIVCHFDHQLRGRSSRADARFVEKLAAKFPCAESKMSILPLSDRSSEFGGTKLTGTCDSIA